MIKTVHDIVDELMITTYIKNEFFGWYIYDKYIVYMSFT